MKTGALARIVGGLVFLLFLNSCPIRLFADAQTYAPPTYRGKVVLIVDKTIAADPNVSSRIQRLIGDLTGDGWKVLRHDVDRGPQHPDGGIGSTDPGYGVWAQANAPRVREIRALIKADYDASPTEVKQVFLIGHVPVPYSGQGPGVSGGHYSGAQPADAFYADTTSPYGATGWSDWATDTSPPYPEFRNSPGDGKFDQASPPSAYSLGVGRVDLFDMPAFGVNETTLISRYLDKDHDFRCANFAIQRRSIMAGDPLGPFCLTPDPFQTVFGNNITDTCGNPPNWPIGMDYLMGYAGDYGNPFDAIGFLATGTFAAVDVQVVFMNLYGSFIANWDEQNDLLRAVLASPYDPANGRFGYGLTAAWLGLGLDQTSLTKRAQGATIGEALFVGSSSVAVNLNLMGDPTLRLHSVKGPTGLTVSANLSQATLNWTASADTAVTGYNVYTAPTPNGPYTLLNTPGPISGNSYTATRPASGGVPDNFYMVRAVKPETTPAGNYVNMSEGVTAPVATRFTPYLTIVSQPVNAKLVAHTQDGIANSVVFSVDAIGVDSAGDQQITYQWYYNGSPLVDGARIHGANSSALLISAVQNSDVGSYYVVIGNGQPVGSTGTPIQSSTATLTINDSPIAVDDTFTVIRNTPTDLNVLANDSDPDDPNSALSVVSVSDLSVVSGAAFSWQAGTIAINPDHRSIHFTPVQGFLGTVTFTYAVSDGTSGSRATVTLNVVPHPDNQAPVVTPNPISNQSLSEFATVDVPFTVNDDYTAMANLQISATASDSTLVPSYDLNIIQTGANTFVLRIRAASLAGACNVTLSVQDEDLGVTTRSFAVTISPNTMPALVPTGLQGDGFHFTVVDPAHSAVEIKESDDLVTWTSLGNVTLSGGSYSFVDGTAGSVTHRFYSASDANGCSVNMIGFVTVTVPTQNSSGGQAYIALSNPLNNPAGNTIDVLFGALPRGSIVDIWDPHLQTYNGYRKTGTPPRWSGIQALNPGTGAVVHAGGTTPVTVTFIGDVPTSQQANYFSTPSPGSYTSLSSIIPRSGTLDQLGFPAVQGDQIQKLDSTEANFVTVATFSGGSWTPSVPTLQVGESFFLLSAGAGSRTWIEDLPSCPPAPPTISTYAGQSGGISTPTGLFFDSKHGGNLFIADLGNRTIEQVWSDGSLHNAFPNSSYFSSPVGVAVDANGYMYVADADMDAILEFQNWSQPPFWLGQPDFVNTFTGFTPQSLAMDAYGNLYFVDEFVWTYDPGQGSYTYAFNDVSVMSVDNTFGSPSGNAGVIAGNGTQGDSGFPGSATSASMYLDDYIFQNGTLTGTAAVDSQGNVYIADIGNNAVRKVSNGAITTLAGDSGAGYSGDGGLATAAQLNHPSAVAVDSQGNVYIADGGNNVIRKIASSPSGNIITTIAGSSSGQAGYTGDNGPAANATLNSPSGLTCDPSGNLYISDMGNHVIRKITFH